MEISGTMDDSCWRHMMFALLDQDVLAHFETEHCSFWGKVLSISSTDVGIEFIQPGTTDESEGNDIFAYQAFKKITIG